jgi:hypothetical protein
MWDLTIARATTPTPQLRKELRHRIMAWPGARAIGGLDSLTSFSQMSRAVLEIRASGKKNNGPADVESRSAQVAG